MELSMRSRKELTTRQAGRYRQASRAQKGKILDEFVAASGYNRDYAAMLLRSCGRERVQSTGGGKSIRLVTTTRPRKAGGRPPVYGQPVRRAVEQLWKLFGHLCGKRLVVLMREVLVSVKRHPELRISAATCDSLQRISAATVDRILRCARAKLRLKGISHTKPTSALVASIPIRTFAEWSAVGPGHLQIDLVGHDGGNASGEFCYTLVATDVCLGWSELRALRNKAAKWVKAALEEICGELPFAVVELHPDNGSEFLNHAIADYCREKQIRLTRSRPGRKNDNCYVEQKNFDLVRKLVGYARYEGDHAVERLNQLYRLGSSLWNLYYPSQKLLETHRHGSTVRKRFDRPRSPARRLLDRGELSPKKRWNLVSRMKQTDAIETAIELGRLQTQVLAAAIRYPIQQPNTKEVSA